MNVQDQQEAQAMIEEILEWAYGKNWFDDGFVRDCEKQLGHSGYLTYRQLDAITNIYQRFNIGEAD